jgi:hypothetical protein
VHDELTDPARALAWAVEVLRPPRVPLERISLHLSTRPHDASAEVVQGRGMPEADAPREARQSVLRLYAEAVLFLVVELRAEPSRRLPGQVQLSLPDLDARGAPALGNAAWVVARRAVAHHGQLCGTVVPAAGGPGEASERSLEPGGPTIQLELQRLLSFETLGARIDEAAATGDPRELHWRYERSRLQDVFRRYPCPPELFEQLWAAYRSFVDGLGPVASFEQFYTARMCAGGFLEMRANSAFGLLEPLRA